ncbi:disease resistance protein RPS2-like [Dioscorea cayenensis subsp. rotundata]|uniref:Disease resistance protein RPS2-like n=1 Tax=Dioscorea cayennensis subsp. rotundata TaxID=55577 RepID=A0AB40ARC2_DIOCR|nr:disease resistance protein RPS2-like [Dioscorea cayenensis subsp. rotundata]
MWEFIDKIVGFFWDPVKNCISREVEFIVSWEDNLDALGKEIIELNPISKDLTSQVEAVERRGKDAKSVAKSRLKLAKDYEEKASKMDRKRKKMTKCLCGLPLNIFAASKISKTAVAMLPDVKKLTTLPEGNLEDVTRAESAPRRFIKKLVGLTKGDESVSQQLERHVQDVNVPVIGVYGMPAVGKTDIMRQLNNQLHATKPEHYIFCVDMPQDLELKDVHYCQAVQQAIGKQLAIIGEDQNATQDDLAGLITKQLNESRFVLILDGLHKPLNLIKDVGIPPLSRPTNNKIIVVGQSREICNQMDADEKVHVKCMECNVAWKLFESKVDKELLNSNRDIYNHARNLVTKCGGLPPVVSKLGQTMESKKTVGEWASAVTTMDTAPWELVGMEIFSRHLKVSYDKLANEQLRTCLLYCSLYPEGFSIYKEWIIDYCIGEGIIDGVTMEEIYNKGDVMLGKLKSAHLLETGEDENYVKMHPMIRGLALWIASDFGEKANKWLVRPQAGLAVIPLVERWRDVERISLMRNDISEISEIPECPNLKTLMLQRNQKLEKICDGFFSSMTQLRVVDLSHNLLKQLPAGIQMMEELRYLDLCGTNIKSLPRELKELKKLRFLLLSFMPYLQTIPDEVISSLVELQVLYIQVSYGKWRVGSIGRGVDFNELNALKQLTAFGITIQTVHALQSLVQSRRLATCTRYLHIKGCQGLPTINVPSSVLGSDMKKLETIRLSDSDELEEVVIGEGTNEKPVSSHLPNLETLVLYRLKKAKMVYNGGCVSHLRQLYIWYCHGMEHLVQHDEVRTDEEDDDAQGPVAVIDAFPNLKVIQLIGLSMLKTLSTGMTMLSFPSLETLTVSLCTNFNKLEMKAEKLKEIRGEKSWWDKLEWEDDSNMKSTFQPLFKKSN